MGTSAPTQGSLSRNPLCVPTVASCFHIDFCAFHFSFNSKDLLVKLGSTVSWGTRKSPLWPNDINKTKKKPDYNWDKRLNRPWSTQHWGSGSSYKQTDWGLTWCSSRFGTWFELRSPAGKESMCSAVTEMYVLGVRLFAAQEWICRPDWWKGKFALFQMPVTGDGRRVVDICPKANSTPPPPRPWQARGEGIYRQSRGEGQHTETSQSSLTVVFKLVITGLTSIILVVLGTVNL